MDRRDFLRNGVWGVAGLGLVGALGNGAFSALARAAAAKPAKGAGKAGLALARNPKVVTSPGSFDKSIVNDLLNKTVCLLSGEKKPRDAWAKLIAPAKSDVIGIKVNCLGGRICRSAPELVYAICDNLESIGVDKSRIIIWDRGSKELASRGYRVNTAPGDVRCFGTDPDRGFSERASKMGEKEIHLSRILTDDISILINVPIMKDHGGAGITGAMKNHYGSFKWVWLFHDNNCDPHLAYLNLIPEIKDKTRLIVVDAMRPVYNGGPGDKDRWDYGAIFAGRDPVATDALCLHILDAKRKQMGMPSIAASGRARHIQTAERLGLGTANLGEVTVMGDPIGEA